MINYTDFRKCQLASCLLLIVACTGCRAYQFGSPTLYCSDIQSIHVDMFGNDTYRKFLGQRLTEAVAKEVELNTPMRLADRAVAQSVLQGRLLRERKRVLTETVNDDPRDIEIDYLVEVTWTDRNGRSLMPRQYLQIDRSVDFIPEGGQSLTTAEQELINRIARQVVQQMEVPW